MGTGAFTLHGDGRAVRSHNSCIYEIWGPQRKEQDKSISLSGVSFVGFFVYGPRPLDSTRRHGPFLKSTGDIRLSDMIGTCDIAIS